ncbi:FHA domain-containing protein [Promicromonospora sp. AC04]|uniref:FHA domain-containing protein n=1 Tax=Promicromonospora sp. AC04 TaxID=2135723 RepID=UPI000D39CC23|nr:FHA domain-containing protein [Promicromonospora sp. AC04]PUB30143.1 FHA domain-containing protein [Promicromonospora sp. AC04]
MTVHYSEGSARAVVRNGTVVVLPGQAPAGVVDALWTALDRLDGGVAATLGVLAAGGLAETPPFAVVSLSGGEPATAAHVAVRGTGVKVVVSAEGAGGPVEVTGAGVVTWSERVVDGPTSFAITTEEVPADEEFPVQAAVVRASSLRRTLVDVPETPDVPSLIDVPALLDGVPAMPAAGADEFPDFPTLAGISTVLPGGRAPSETIVPGAPDVPEAGGESPAEPPSAPEPAPLLGLGTVPGPGSGTEVDESTQFGTDDDDYGHLFGDTVMRRVEDAAVRQGEDDEEVEEEAAEPAPASAPPMPPPPVPDPPQSSEPADALISGVPGGWTPPSTAPEPLPGGAQRAASVGDSPAEAAPVDGMDHDGETMMSSDLAALRKAAGASGPKFSVGILPGAPQILGLPCPQGHPNPPTSDRCRTCGENLEGDAELVSRPSLGQMLVTGGVQPGIGGPQVVELDRPVVVGRRPRTNNASADRTPRLVTVASPDQDISRSHVEITLEEWHVLVADLATTNGTTLLRPGQPPRRLHPNEKVIVVEGDVVDLGDGATLTFEGIW